jgi:dihydropteroate synthase
VSQTISLAGGREIRTGLDAFVMGILNATPDSFWEKSRSSTLADGVSRALSLVADGADVIDIGGESTRPGSAYVGEEEEISRVIPLVRAIRKECGVPISVDTRKAAVMRAAIDEGADICNDISALEDDGELAPLIASAGIPVILMHKQGVPVSMQDSPSYADPVREVADYLFARARFAESTGIARGKIILDPGIGFGKRYEDNCALIDGLAEIVRGGYPVLMALSRKSCVGRMTGRETADRLAGTLAANLVAVRNGASFLRVHDVRETVDMLSVLQEIKLRGIH